MLTNICPFLGHTMNYLNAVLSKKLPHLICLATPPPRHQDVPLWRQNLWSFSCSCWWNKSHRFLVPSFLLNYWEHSQLFSAHTPVIYICVNDRTWKHKSQIRRGERSSLRRLDKGGQCSQGSDLHNQQQPLKAPPAAVYKTPSPLPVYPPFDPHPSYVDPGIHQWEGFRRSWLTFDIKPFPSCCLLHSQFWQTYIISSWIQILPLLVMVVSGCMSGLHHQSQVHPQDQHHEGYLQDYLQMDHHRPHMQSHGFQRRSALPWGFSGGFRRRFGGYGSLGYTGYGHHHHHHHHEHCHFYEDGHHHCY